MDTRSVKAHNTISKRILCTVSQKYWWLKTYEEYLQFIWKNNIGVFPNTGKSFGEFIDNVLVGGYERNLILDADSELIIVVAT